MWLFEIRYDDAEWNPETHEIKMNKNRQYVVAENLMQVYEKLMPEMTVKNRELVSIHRHDVPIVQIIPSKAA